MSGVNKEFKTIDERIALLKSRNLKFKAPLLQMGGNCSLIYSV